MLEAATPGLEPKWKLEETAMKGPEKLEFLELEWFQFTAAESE